MKRRFVQKKLSYRASTIIYSSTKHTSNNEQRIAPLAKTLLRVSTAHVCSNSGPRFLTTNFILPSLVLWLKVVSGRIIFPVTATPMSLDHLTQASFHLFTWHADSLPRIPQCEHVVFVSI